MWIEKVSKNSFGLHHLFEQYLDEKVYNHIEITGKVKIAGEEFYKVTATQYVKDIKRNFYFSDFTVLTDFFDNSAYARKQRDILADIGWEILVMANLDEIDKKEYKKQFKFYQRQKLKEDRELLNEFNK